MAAIDISSPASGGSGGGGNLQLAGGASMTSTLTSVTDTSNTSSPLKLSTTAVQVLSPLRITTSDASGFYLDAEDSATNNRFSIKRDPSSQEVTLDFASNPSGSTTLVGAIRTYIDGTNLSNAMSFIEDGSVGIGTNSPSQKVHIVGSLRIQSGGIYDGTNSIGTSGQVLSSTGTSTAWVTPSGGSPAGTTGAVQFNNAGAFGADSTNFFWNNTTKRLGIGTNTPAASLDIYEASFPTFALSNTSGILQFYKDANKVLFGSTISSWVSLHSSTNTSFGSTADLSARVGIRGSGSTSATTSLLVQNSASTQLMNMTDDGRMTIGNSGTNAGALLFQFPNVGTNGVIWGDSYSSKFGDITLSRGTGEMRFNTDTGGYYQTFRTSNVERMRIEGNGLIGIGTSSPNASSVVDVSSTSKGFLPPRMTTAQKNAISTPAAGLMVYDTTLNKLCVRTAAAWETITSV